MTRYYVYSMKLPNGDKKQFFVENVEAFAEEVFNPTIMEFTNTVIDADDQRKASSAFKSPKSTDKIYYSDEPECTASKKRNFDILNQKKKDLEIIARGIELKKLQGKLANRLDELYIITRDIARILYNSSDNPQLEIDDIHDRLLNKIAAHLRHLGSEGDEPESEADGQI